MSAEPKEHPNLAPLALTMGEPAGIGPEVILRAWLARNTQQLPSFFVVGDADYFSYLKNELGLNVPVLACDPEDAKQQFNTALPVVNLDGKVLGKPGKFDSTDAKLVSGAITEAVGHVFSKKASAVVTAPINKKALYDSGFSFPGHTEFLAALAEERTGKTVTPVMMLAGSELRTIPVTIHIPLSKVPLALTTELIVETGTIAARDLQSRFSIETPRLAVSGLNPHAGENGAMGSEDIEIIKPAVEKLAAAGISVTGPMPADTMFHASARNQYDVAICMYHDQALIPAKTLAFDDAVNITLGLPFIRTSPDHGTALDIAAKGIANPSSMIAAIKMAGEMATETQCNSVGNSA